MGTPSLFTMTMPETPLWVLMRLRVSSTSDMPLRSQRTRGESDLLQDVKSCKNG